MSNMHAPSGYYDVVVYGATPGGISAAIGAARYSLNVALVEPSPFIGGMMTSGLGRTDIDSLEASGSIFREFASRVFDHYVCQYGQNSSQVNACNHGLWFEPSVAKKVFRDMLNGEANVDLFCSYSLQTIEVESDEIQAVTFITDDVQGASYSVQARAFIDGTYEADLAAMAGVPYDVGRESRDDFNEEFAGKIYMDYHPNKEVFPGSTGEGDNLIQAYNFRLCLTKNPENRVPIAQPRHYVRREYTSLIDDIQAGRVRSIADVMSMGPVPNEKFDCNNHHFCMCSTDLPEENGAYPEGSRAVREKIVARHREYIQGLLWFLQNDEALPDSFKTEAQQWGYAADEFTETDHFPPQIYVREARRIHGEYTFSENDARLAPGLGRTPIHVDSIAVGAYQIDSHATRKREPAGKDVALEGFMGLRWLTHHYQIPFSIMVPQVIQNLLVPVAVSATHVGFGTVRMEPFWMQLGFAAGVASALRMNISQSFRALPIDLLQDVLLDTNQKITYFTDSPTDEEMRKAIEYFGTKGFFDCYDAKINEGMLVKEASIWIAWVRGLPGGSRIPTLPATEHVLPSGVDMGPRLPREEISPAQYWMNQPNLTVNMAKRWLNTAQRVLKVKTQSSFSEKGDVVTRGEFCTCLYQLLKESRQRTYGSKDVVKNKKK